MWPIQWFMVYHFFELNLPSIIVLVTSNLNAVILITSPSWLVNIPIHGILNVEYASISSEFPNISWFISLNIKQLPSIPLLKYWQWVQTRIPFVFNIKIIGIYGSSCHSIYLQKIWKKTYSSSNPSPYVPWAKTWCIYIYTYGCGHLTIIGNLFYG